MVSAGDKVFYFVNTISMEDMKDTLIKSGVNAEDFESDNITLTNSEETYYLKRQL